MRDGWLVHFTLDKLWYTQVRSGDIITVMVTAVASHHLIVGAEHVDRPPRARWGRTRCRAAPAQYRARYTGCRAVFSFGRACRACPMSKDRNVADFFNGLCAEVEAAERRIEREIEPGARGFVVAILVFVLLGSFILPHTGQVLGWDVLFGSHSADIAAVALPSRLFAWLALVFGIGFSMLALMTRRWALAWVALTGAAMASIVGLLAVWSRQTAAEGQPGPGVGLIVAWITLILLTFHWSRVVWSRTIVQLVAEE